MSQKVFHFRSTKVLKLLIMIRKVTLLLYIILFIFYSEDCFTQDSEKIFYNGFSHNDYWRPKPLLDALSYRFNCVEADLWLVDGQLYVAHSRSEIDKANTFEDMYLKPLSEIIKKNGGKVYSGSIKPFFLMVDCKTSGEEMYPVLEKIMDSYKEMFSSVNNEEYKEGAVLLFFSGNRPYNTLTGESVRLAFLDGTVSELNKGIPAYLMPVVSNNYREYFTWNGRGEMPEDQLQKMRDIINQTHKEGKLLRWWGAPETKIFRQLLLKEGVDLLGTDDLEQLYKILIGD